MSLQVVYITCSSQEEAKKLAKILLEKKLIACANIYPVDSLYIWDGKISEDKECILWCKTIESRIKQIRAQIKNTHSYMVPCIVNFTIDAIEDYNDWVLQQVEPA